MQSRPQLHLFSVADYHRMGAAGVFADGARVELIDGEVVDMVPIGATHAGQVNRLTRLFYHRLAGRVTVAVQNPIRLGDLSEPQPDLLLLQPRSDDYAGRHPEAVDALLAVEVADSSLEQDRRRKIPLYGRFGIPEAWLVDLVGRAIEVYRNPGPQGYAEVRRLTAGERIGFADGEWPVAEVLVPVG